MWRERIALAGEGTEAQKRLQEQFDQWYVNRLNKPMIDESRKAVEQINSDFRDGFRELTLNGLSTWKATNKSLVTSFKTQVVDQIYKMFAQPFIIKLAASALGTLGLSGPASGGNLLGTVSNGFSLYNGISNVASAVGGWLGLSGATMGLTGATGITATAAAGSLGSGLAVGGGGLGFGAVGGTGLTLGSAGTAAATGTAGAVTGAGSMTTAAGAGAGGLTGMISAIPGWGWALAGAALIAKALDDSGTMHTGGAASASSSGVQSIDARALGFMNIDRSADTEKMVSGIATSIVGILDSTATTFGKTAGFTAATAFADDTSKDGAWGALRIARSGASLVDWDSDRQSRWAPREFSDGEAGRDQYLSSLSASIRTALDDIGLPGWAQTMLDSLGDAPAINDLASVVDNINATQQAIVMMGNALSGVADLSDEAVTALISASGGVAGLTSAFNGYYDAIYSEEEKLAETRRQVTEAISAVGLTMPTTREDFRALVESQLALDEAGAPAVAALLRVSGAFAAVTDAADAAAKEEEELATARRARVDSATDVFNTALYTDGEKAAREATNLARGLSELGLSEVTTIEQFRNVVDAIDTTTESGLEMYEALAKLAPAFRNAVDAADAAAAAARKTAVDNAQTALDTQMRGVETAYATIQRSVEAERKRITSAYDSAVKSFNDRIKDVTGSVGKLSSLSNSLRSTVDRMRLPSEFEADRAAAQAQIQTAIALARAGGILPDAESLSNALNIVSQPAENLFESLVDYQRDFFSTRINIAELADITDIQLSVEEQTLASLQEQLRLEQENYAGEMSRLDGVLAFAQESMDTLNGIERGVTLSIPEAIAALQTRIGSAASAQASLGNATNTTATSITGLYHNILGRDPRTEGATFWQNAAITNPKPWNEFVADFIGGAVRTGGTDAERAIAYARANGIPGFAGGGNHLGGWRLVGEYGPEIEYTPPSRIFNAAQTARMRNGFGGDDSRNDLELMRAAVERLEVLGRTTKTAVVTIAEVIERVGGGGSFLVEVEA